MENLNCEATIGNIIEVINNDATGSFWTGKLSIKEYLKERSLLKSLYAMVDNRTTPKDRSDAEAFLIKLTSLANSLFNDDEKEEFVEYAATHNIELRICSNCNKIIFEGCCVDEGDEHYCSEICLNSANVDGEVYWTDWI